MKTDHIPMPEPISISYIMLSSSIEVILSNFICGVAPFLHLFSSVIFDAYVPGLTAHGVTVTAVLAGRVGAGGGMQPILIHTWNSNCLGAPQEQSGMSCNLALCSLDTHSGSPPLQYRNT